MKILNAVLPKLSRINGKFKKKIKNNFKIWRYQLANSAPLRSADKAFLNIIPTANNTKCIGSNWLINFKNNQHSEHGEDGVIEQIFQILKPENKWVCEFGAHDPEIISNTWRLINKEGWNALLIEADSHYFGKLKDYYKFSESVHCVQSMVSYEGENKLDNILQNTPVPPDLDFMVIDIDGNDYHVWEAMKTYNAKVMMIEFNASIPTGVSYVQPRDLTVNHGNSLRALTELAVRKGYKLIAVTGWNAFFVQDQYYHLFFCDEPALEEMYVEPARYPVWMRSFQLYDGTIVIAPWNEMLWHRIDLKMNDYQVLPETFRRFSRELSAHGKIFEKNGEIVSAETENKKYQDAILHMPANVLGKYAKNFFSRNGEDGILEKLSSLTATANPTIVDVGAWDGLTQSRSRNLIENHGWNGLLLESDKGILSALHGNYHGNQKVRFSESAISSRHSLDKIFQSKNLPSDFDVLTLNVYGMEYYLWDAMKKFAPKIIAVQFNSTIPNDVEFIQPNDYSIHQGCSLRALCDLAAKKDYELVAVTLETAFFVKKKQVSAISAAYGFKSADLDAMFCPAEMRLFQLYDGTIALDGLDHLLWHGIRIDEEKLQVVPKSLRTFHQYADVRYKKLFYRVENFS